MNACQIPECNLPPNYRCLCTEPESKLCDRHAAIHLASEGSHSLLPNYIGLLKKKVQLSLHCTNCIKNFKTTNEKILQILNHNITNITTIAIKYIQENNKINQLYIETLDYLDRNDRIIKKTNFLPVEEFILKYLDNSIELLNFFGKAETEILKEINLKCKLEEILKLNQELIKLNIDLNQQKEGSEKLIEKSEEEFKKKIKEFGKIIEQKNEEIIKITEEKIRKN